MDKEEKKNVILNDEELKEVAGGKRHTLGTRCSDWKRKIDCEKEIRCFWTWDGKCIRN